MERHWSEGCNLVINKDANSLNHRDGDGGLAWPGGPSRDSMFPLVFFLLSLRSRRWEEKRKRNSGLKKRRRFGFVKLQSCSGIWTSTLDSRIWTVSTCFSQIWIDLVFLMNRLGHWFCLPFFQECSGFVRVLLGLGRAPSNMHHMHTIAAARTGSWLRHLASTFGWPGHFGWWLERLSNVDALRNIGPKTKSNSKSYGSRKAPVNTPN